ncbi:MAG: RidA family protein [Betaproteobacteria bacterium]|nr:RidA family protein [Betaproteobacteria bacterium]
MMHTKRVLVAEHPGLGAGLVEAGSFLFTSGCDGQRELHTGRIDPGLAGQVEAQCENSYGAVALLLGAAGVGMESVVRLDHFTRSQDWLPRRQTVRGRIFGKPAPLTSTGVAARMAGINLLTTAVIAVRSPKEKTVMVSGPAFAMENISSAVAAGPFLFVSGLRDARNASAAHPDALRDEALGCYEKMRRILHLCGATTDRILRLDCYLRDVQRDDDERAVRRSLLGDEAWAAATTGVLLGGKGEIEVTALALARGHGEKQVISMPDSREIAAVCGGGFVFVGACRAPALHQSGMSTDPERALHAALDLLDARLRLAGTDLAAVARIDLYLGDISWAERLGDTLRERFPGGLPAVVAAGADSGHGATVSLCAIAVQGRSG